MKTVAKLEIKKVIISNLNDQNLFDNGNWIPTLDHSIPGRTVCVNNY